MESIPIQFNIELRIKSEVTDHTTQLPSSLAQSHTYQCIVVPMIVVTMVYNRVVLKLASAQLHEHKQLPIRITISDSYGHFLSNNTCQTTTQLDELRKLCLWIYNYKDTLASYQQKKRKKRKLNLYEKKKNIYIL